MENIKVMIVAHNQYRQVLLELEYLQGWSGLGRDSIVIVDNYSNDELPGWLSEQSDLDYIICDEKVEHFSDILNTVISEYIRDEDIFLLNPDFMVLPDTIAGLSGCLAAKDSCGAVYPAVIRRDQREYGENLGSVLTYTKEKKQGLAVNRKGTFPFGYCLISNGLLKSVGLADTALIRPDNTLTDLAFRGSEKGFYYLEAKNIFIYQMFAAENPYDFIYGVSADERRMQEKWSYLLERFKIEIDEFEEIFRENAREIYLRYKPAAADNTRAFCGRGVVYTVITGNYDDLNEPEFVNPDFDYICFTDNRKLRSEIWKMRVIDNENHLDMTRLARRYKIMCSEYLPEYDYSIYIDGKIQIRGDLKDYIKKYSAGRPMLCFPHFLRTCAYEEAEACIAVHKDDPGIITAQMEGYREAGFPENYGMIDSACLVREHHNAALNKVLEDWWHEVREKSKRDQLSIEYACWKNNFQHDLCDLYIYQNRYICKKRKWEKSL